MKTTFSISDFESLQTLVAQLKNNRPEDVSENSYLQQALMEQLENLSQTEAEHIVNEITAGIADFTLQYNNQVADGKDSVEEIIRQAIVNNDMDEANAMRYLASIIIVMRMQKNGAAPLTDEEIQAQLDEVLRDREVNADSVEALIQEAVAEIKQNALLAVDDRLANQIASTKLDAQAVSTIKEMTDAPLYVAIAAYIAGAKGELEMPESYDNPRLLGVGVASGLKTMELTGDLAGGIIDENVWMQYIKIVTGVTLALAVGYLALNVMAAISVGLFIAGVLILGEGTVAVICSSILALGFLVWTASHLVADVTQLIPVYNEWFDKAVNWIATFIPQASQRLKSAYQVVREKLLALGHRVKEKFTTTTETTEEVAVEGLQPAFVTTSN